MATVKMVYWQEEDAYIGHFEDYPDYRTQGMTLEELKENLRDLYADLTSGEISGIRKVEDLDVA